MQIEVKYFYKNGVEVKRGDLVYIKGTELNFGDTFCGLYQIGDLDEKVLTIYPCGQDEHSNQSLTVYIDFIETLIKLDRTELNRALDRALATIPDELKDRD